MNQFKAQLISSIFVLSSAGATAQGLSVADPSSFLGPIGAGKAASGVASSLRHDSVFINPAAGAIESLYSMSANYGATGDLMSASIVDSKSGPVAGAAYYLRRDTKAINPEGFLGNYQREEEQAGISLMGKASDKVALGVTGRYLRQTLSDVDNKRRSDWDADIGFRWAATNELAIGGVARAMLKEESGLSPTQYSFGAEYLPFPGVSVSGAVTKTQINRAGVRYDVQVPNPSEEYSYALGAEWLMTMGISLRGGMNWLLPWDQNIASLGLGYMSQGFAANYTFSASVQGATYSQHLIGLSYEL